MLICCCVNLCNLWIWSLIPKIQIEIAQPFITMLPTLLCSLCYFSLKQTFLYGVIHWQPLQNNGSRWWTDRGQVYFKNKGKTLNTRPSHKKHWKKSTINVWNFKCIFTNTLSPMKKMLNTFVCFLLNWMRTWTFKV